MRLKWVDKCKLFLEVLRILAIHEAKYSKICNFWTFWAVIQLIKIV